MLKRNSEGLEIKDKGYGVKGTPKSRARSQCTGAVSQVPRKDIKKKSQGWLQCKTHEK